MTPTILMDLQKLIRQNELPKFYWRKEWKKIKQVAAKRDNFECQQCKAKGTHKHYRSVHHKKEVKDYPELALDLNNLECLCEDCHNKKHEKGKCTKKANKEYSKECW